MMSVGWAESSPEHHGELPVIMDREGQRNTTVVTVSRTYAQEHRYG